MEGKEREREENEKFKKIVLKITMSMTIGRMVYPTCKFMTCLLGDSLHVLN